MFCFRRYKAVAKKEFLELRRNILFFMMTVFAPVMFYFLFAYGFPLDAKNISMGVVDFDKTVMSRSLIDSFESATELFNIKMVADNYAPVEKEMDLGHLRLILVINQHFERDLRRGVPASVQVLVDGAYPNTANIVGGYTEAIIAAFRMNHLGDYFEKRLGSNIVANVPIDLTVSTWYNPSFRSEDFVVPAIIALVMVFFPPIVATISLSREKETGSILNMYCSSITKAEYLLGKMTPYIIISYINFLLFLALTIFLFHVPMRGSLAVLMTVSFFYIAAVIAVGLLVAILVGSQVAAILITFVGTVMPAFLYSGFMVPISSMANDAQTTSKFLPPTYYIDLIRKVMVKGAGFRHVASNAIIIVGLCLGLYFICIRLFKKRIG